ncbi:CPCC family cysteine-rich protein [Streptomyces sp. NPDC007905]|uniref:CPCC family cysteine-rich protein n=1 Tax=Streptomyces sp. NPDC007905 TaxID=3364788 RepID=UPI0036DFDD8B
MGDLPGVAPGGTRVRVFGPASGCAVSVGDVRGHVSAGERAAVEVRTVYPCPCCGYLVLDDGPGRYEICRICRWEDDPGQLRSPRLSDGANKTSLTDAQRSFAETGASDPRRLARASAPREADRREPGWRPFEVGRGGGPDGKTESGYWRDAPHPHPRSNSVNNGL